MQHLTPQFTAVPVVLCIHKQICRAQYLSKGCRCLPGHLNGVQYLLTPFFLLMTDNCKLILKLFSPRSPFILFFQTKPPYSCAVYFPFVSNLPLKNAILSECSAFSLHTISYFSATNMHWFSVSPGNVINGINELHFSTSFK